MSSSCSSSSSSSSSSSTTSSLLLTSGASGRVNAIFSMRALKGLIMLINAFLLLLLVPFRVKNKRSSSNCTSSNSSSSSSSSCSCSSPSSMDDYQKQKESGGGGEGGGGGHRKTTATKVLRVSYHHRRNMAGVTEDRDVMIRRSIAIRRVNDDDEEESVRDVSMFVTSRGDTLFTQSWTPLSNPIKGLVVLLHGLNEHSGRYGGFAKQLNANGYKVYGMDWIGHGGSDGLHGYVHSLDHAVNDLKAFLEKVLTENPGLPCFLFGHSTGAAIILKAVLDPKIEKLISGVALTSPAVGVQPSHPIFGVLAPIFSFLLPKYQFSAANKNGTKVSRDPEALIAKYSDPLVFTGAIRIRTGAEILRISSYLQQNMNRLTVPFIVLHGTDDAVTNPEASKKLYEEAPSTDKSIKLYKGLLHDLLFEPEKEIITKDIIDWLNSRVKI